MILVWRSLVTPTQPQTLQMPLTVQALNGLKLDWALPLPVLESVLALVHQTAGADGNPDTSKIDTRDVGLTYGVDDQPVYT